MRAEFNPNDFVLFVLKPEFIKRSRNGFKLAYDLKEKLKYQKNNSQCDAGDYFEFVDNRGNAKKLSFTSSHRVIRVPKIKQDEIEAIRNHPQCEGSPNGIYTYIDGKKVQLDCLFKEINDDKDAEVAIEATKLRSQAMSEAVKLLSDEDRAEQVALILGIQTSGSSSHARLLLYAERNPVEFLNTLNSPDTEARGLVQKALKLGVLQRRGVSLFLGDFDYGIEVDDVVKTILKEQDKFRLLFKKVTGRYPDEEVEVTEEEKPKRRGFQKKTEQ